MQVKVENLNKTYKAKVKSGFIRDLFFPKFKDIHAVQDISFEISKGESVALLGPNGAGKTTTMKMLSGLIYPTSGSIDVLGYFPFDRKKDFLRKIGLVMGNKTSLEWDLTPNQSFQLTRQIYRIPKKVFEKRAKMLTDMLDTSKFMDTQVRKLSLGERLKMEIISSILHDPDVLFLDEPTIGLDVISKFKIRNFLRNLQKESDVTLLLTSHDMIDVEKVCDRVIVINQGVKVYDNSLDELVKHYNKERYVKFIFRKLPAKEKIERYGEIANADESAYTLKVDSENMSQIIAKITSKYKLLDIDILSVPLDEVIADIFKNSS